MLTWQHPTVAVQHAPALPCIPGQFPSAGPLCLRGLSRYQLAPGESIFAATAGTRQGGGWLSSGAATCRLLALIYRGRNGDLTALPQKSGPSDAWKRDSRPPPPPPPPPASHKCTRRTKSKRAVGQSASVQHRPVSADLPDGSQRARRDWGGEGWRGAGVGRGRSRGFSDGT